MDVWIDGYNVSNSSHSINQQHPLRQPVQKISGNISFNRGSDYLYADDSLLDRHNVFLYQQGGSQRGKNYKVYLSRVGSESFKILRKLNYVEKNFIDLLHLKQKFRNAFCGLNKVILIVQDGKWWIDFTATDGTNAGRLQVEQRAVRCDCEAMIVGLVFVIIALLLLLNTQNTSTLQDSHTFI